jgi:hypothetical protein
MDDRSGNGKTPPGWYPHPTMAGTRQYWDGEQWTDNIAPMDTAEAESKSANQSQMVTVAILAASVIGLVMAFQSASLLTGTGTQWTGAAIAIAAGIATIVLRKSISTWLRVVAVIIALAAVANVIYLEVEMEKRRSEIGDLFSS